jgi:hypothetical protein
MRIHFSKLLQVVIFMTGIGLAAHAEDGVPGPEFRTYNLTPSELSALNDTAKQMFGGVSYADPAIPSQELIDRFLARVYLEAGQQTNPDWLNFVNELRGKPLDVYDRNILGLVNQALDQHAATVEFRPDAGSGVFQEEFLRDGNLFRAESYKGFAFPETDLSGRQRIILGKPSPFVGKQLPGMSAAFTTGKEYFHEMAHYLLMTQSYQGRAELNGSVKATDKGPIDPWQGKQVKASIGTYANEIDANLWVYQGDIHSARVLVEGTAAERGTYFALEAWLTDVVSDLPAAQAQDLASRLRALTPERRLALARNLSNATFRRSPNHRDAEVVRDLLADVERPNFKPSDPMPRSSMSHEFERALLEEFGGPGEADDLRRFLAEGDDISITVRGKYTGIRDHALSYLKSIGWNDKMIDYLRIQSGFNGREFYNLITSPHFLEIHGYATLTDSGSPYLRELLSEVITDKSALNSRSLISAVENNVRPQIRNSNLGYYADEAAARFRASQQSAEAARYRAALDSPNAPRISIAQIEAERVGTGVMDRSRGIGNPNLPPPSNGPLTKNQKAAGIMDNIASSIASRNSAASAIKSSAAEFFDLKKGANNVMKSLTGAVGNGAMMAGDLLAPIVGGLATALGYLTSGGQYTADEVYKATGKSVQEQITGMFTGLVDLAKLITDHLPIPGFNRSLAYNSDTGSFSVVSSNPAGEFLDALKIALEEGFDTGFEALEDVTADAIEAIRKLGGLFGDDDAEKNLKRLRGILAKKLRKRYDNGFPDGYGDCGFLNGGSYPSYTSCPNPACSMPVNMRPPNQKCPPPPEPGTSWGGGGLPNPGPTSR